MKKNYRKLDYIDWSILEYIDRRKTPPSVRQVANIIELGTTATYGRLLKLRDFGLLTWEPRKCNTLRTLDND